MKHHLDQAAHNETFHECIKTEFPDQFFDWRITVLFYISLHLIKGRGAQLGRNLGDTHLDIAKNANPDIPGNILGMSRGAWSLYHGLYRMSQSARYEGIITDFDTFQELKKLDYQDSLELLRKFKLYLNGVGFTC